MEYRLLGKTGVLVSRLCLGTMTFGGKGFWETIGRLQQDDATELVKIALDNGVNFFDTANVYSEGESEKLLGTAIRALNLPRQELFIATKVRGKAGAGLNQTGLSRLHIMDAVNDSLRRLQFDHIDLLYIHGLDKLTPFEETMRGLEDVVRAGKVRYLGCSNIYAWQVAKANGISEKHGWTKFDALQYFYSIAGRDVEREIVPLAESEGLSLMPWSPLAGGFLSGKFTRAKQKADGDSRRNEFNFPIINHEKAFDIIEKMDEIANHHQVSVARVALSWLLHKKTVTSVIIGAKNTDQLKDNLKSIELKLSETEVAVLDSVSDLIKEYPQWMIERQNAGRIIP